MHTQPNNQSLKEKDQRYCWHPFTQAHYQVPNMLIKRSQGSQLWDECNQPYLDAISSWWVVTHGHNHPYITQRIKQQLDQLSHTLFSGVTHPPAIELAEGIIGHLQDKNLDYQWVFYSDNGSTAVEAALKMACQYWHNQGQKRQQFLAFEGAYHGDTFGAMAVGKSSGFYQPFMDWLFEVHFIDYPQITFDVNQASNHSSNQVSKHTLQPQETQILQALEEHLQLHHQNIAAFIFEPLVQGASGMRMASAVFLQALMALLRRYDILMIADEVMTGFSRTGTMFAIEQLLNAPDVALEHDYNYENGNIKANKKAITPDIICASKGITGGFLPLGATITNDKIYQAFLSQDVYKAFLHGHSYTANPLACAAACANLALFKLEHTAEKIQLIEQQHRQHLSQLMDSGLVNGRVCGSILALNVDLASSQNPQHYGSTFSQAFRLDSLKQGVLLRPLGDCIYVLPPYCTSIEQLKQIYACIAEVMQHFRQNQQASFNDLF